MARPSVEFVKYLLGIRAAHTSLTTEEISLLQKFAADKLTIVEVGVYEGVTSLALVKAMHQEGRLFLVDPYVHATRMERWLGFSAPRFVAKRNLRSFEDRVQFIRKNSLEAAAEFANHRAADLIFIDADHAYEAVAADFYAWTPHLDADGIVALHDSRICPRRPDLGAEAGPVRFVDELLAERAPEWSLVGNADTLSAFRRV